MSEKHIPAITKYRDSAGYREGWDRHRGAWVPLAPPPPGCSPEVRRAYRAAVERELAGYEAPTARPRPSAQAPATAHHPPSYSKGYGAGLRKGRAESLKVIFSDEAYETLQELMRLTGRDAGDLLSEALALEKKAIEVRREGGRVLVERHGQRHELISPLARTRASDEQGD